MKTLAIRIFSILALALVIVPPAAFMFQVLHGESLMKGLMLAGTALWFVSAGLAESIKPQR